jgi:Rne/Rng family ribonuclease
MSLSNQHILIDRIEGQLWALAFQKEKGGNRLTQIEIDTDNEWVRSGAVYWAQVLRIDQSIDAAFLALDHEQTGLLFNGDAYAVQNKGKKPTSQSIGQKISPGDMIAVQAKNGVLPPLNSSEKQEAKVAAVSMDISLPGRFVVYAPTLDHNRISKRIRDKNTRRRLETMLEDLPTISGCILRAAALHTQTDMLVREAEILKHIWGDLHKHLGGESPFLVMNGPNAYQRVLTNLAGAPVDKIEVGTLDLFQEVEEWCEVYAPDLVTRIEPAEETPDNDLFDLFDRHDLTGQIDDLFDNYIFLKHGGNIIIEPTAAMTVIDINRGSDTRSNYAVNLEALEEIVRQIRLRNLNGIIMIDVLKMTKAAEKQKLLSKLQSWLDIDSNTIQCHGYSRLGLIELTRQSRSPSLENRYALAID